MRWAPVTSRTLAAAQAAWQGVEKTLWPVCCVFCGERQKTERRPICGDCRADLPWTEPCFQLPPLVTAVAPLRYAFPLDAAIKLFKFRRRLWYATAFAELLGGACHNLPVDIDAVLPMPLHWRRQAFRGFNQASEIALPLARKLGVPVLAGVKRVRATPSQSGLSAAQRRRNLAGAFVARRDFDCKHVLVVDDVITTGASCRGLARVLLDAGVARVSAAAIARAVRD
jgi:ComF family protein